MKNTSLGKNAVLNVVKSVLSVLFPLITYPYAFRVLHAENIGKVDYAMSIINYFSLVAMLGVSSYAIREGAKVRDDRKKISELVSQIFSINVISTAVSYIVLTLTVFFTAKLYDYKELIFLLSISIVFTTLGIDWINTIYEDFWYITVRSIITHIVTLVLLFVLVRRVSDYYYYAFLSVLINIIIGMSNWKYCHKYIDLKFTLKMNVHKHLRPILTLFANNIATSIYVNCDTTMLGWIIGNQSVGLYSMAVKIYNVLKNVMAAIYTVAIPRLSYYIGKKDYDKLRKTYTEIFGGVTLLLLPMSAGIIGIANEVVYFMGGAEYADAVLALQILSIALIGAIFGGLMAYCFNIPMAQEIINLKATTISAILNIELNTIIIPKLAHNGAAITTAISEWFVFFFCLFSAKDIKKYIDIKKYLLYLKDAVIEMFIIYILSRLIHQNIISHFLSLIFIIGLSIAGYLIVLTVSGNAIYYSVLKKIMKRSTK